MLAQHRELSRRVTYPQEKMEMQCLKETVLDLPSDDFRFCLPF